MKNSKFEILNPKHIHLANQNLSEGGQEITIPGFKFAGISAGIKKGRGKDLALIFSETVATVAGLFTTNKIRAASIKLNISHLTSQKGQAIIINSGNANACTGDKGLKDAEEIAEKIAKELDIPSEFVYVASTGVIGKPLPMEKIRKAVPRIVKKLSPHSLKDVASAIMTTDTFPKIAFKKINIGRKTGTIAGVTKGAGMISPNMATMLCFIVTDIAIEPRTLDTALREAVKKSFNRLTIDNEMSTNDMVLIMANGLLENSLITQKSPVYHKFKDALSEVTYTLSRMIAKDGEGATKLIEVVVKGAKTESDAEKAAKAIANSMLVKSMIYGRKPNWGRIMAAIGYSGVEIREQKIDIYLNKLKLVDKGIGLMNKDRIARNILSKKEVIITVDLGIGKGTAKILTCDLTEKYVKINARYTT